MRIRSRGWFILVVALVVTACSSDSLEARFTFSPNGGDTNTTFTFDGSNSITVDSAIVSYAWTFGDGATAEGETVTHRYSEAGDYNVTLTVTAEDGTVDSVSESVGVDPADNVLPDAVIQVTPDTGTTNTLFNFDGTGSTDPDAEEGETFRDDDYTWTFGDGTTATGPQVSHQYETAGTYEVMLTVQDRAGDTNTATISLEVAEVTTRIRALHAAPDVGPVNLGVNGASLNGVGYATASGYLPITGTDLTVTVTPEGASDPALTLTETVADDRDYTVIAIGTADGEDDIPLEALFFEDDSTAPDAGNFKITVVHAAPNASEVDVHVLTGEASDDALASPSNTPITLAYRSITPTLQLPAPQGDTLYRVLITASGDTDVIYDSGLLDGNALSAGVNYTAVAVSDTTDDALSPVQLVLLTNVSSTPFVGVPNINTRDGGSNNTPATATTLDSLGEDDAVRAIGAIEAQGDLDIYAINTTTSALLTVRTQAAGLGSDLDSVITFHAADGTALLSNDDANEDTIDSELQVLVPAGTFLVSVRDFDVLFGDDGAFYDLVVTTEEIRDVPTYGASAGTFAGGSNSSNIAAFSGNALALSATDDGGAVDEPLVALVDIPGGDTLTVYFDPVEASVLEVVLEDLSGITAAAALASFDVSTQALQDAISGTFVFNFPGASLERVVNADASLDLPVITDVSASDDSATVTFDAVEGASSYETEVFGRSSAVAGRATGGSPVTVSLNGSIQADEPLVATVTASDRNALDLPLTETQRNVSQYIFYSE
jgi:PKD repeat protein